MHSKKLQTLFDHIRECETDPVKVAALVGCQKRVNTQANIQACWRCESADFFLTWRPLPSDPQGDSEWVPIVGKCGKFMGLPSDEDGGLLMPMFPSPYCTAMLEVSK